MTPEDKTAPKDSVDEEDLCPNHRLFIAEYIKNGRNQRKAYKKIYGEDMSDEAADANGSRLISNDKVRAVIDRKLQDITDTAEIDAVWALKRRMEIVERAMQAEPVMVFDHEKKKMVETGEYVFDSSGANKALDAIEKIHLGMMDKSEVNHNIAIISKDDESL